MIATRARVISITNGTVQVEPMTESACGACKSHSSCGVSGLAKYFSGTRQAIAVRCDASVQAGAELQLSISEGDLIKAGLLAYLLPSVLALIGAGIAAAYGWGDVGAVLGAAGGVSTGLAIGRLTGWMPKMTAHHKSENFSKGEIP